MTGSEYGSKRGYPDFIPGCRPFRLKVKQLSPSLLFYLVVHSAGLVGILLYHPYVIAQWSVGAY